MGYIYIYSMDTRGGYSVQGSKIKPPKRVVAPESVVLHGMVMSDMAWKNQ